MKYTHIAALIGSITMMTAQLFGQAATPTTPDSRRIRNIAAPNAAPAAEPDKPHNIAAPNAAPAAEPDKPQFESRKLATSDISNIRLNVVSGHIVFTAAGIDYVYYPRTNDHTTPATDVSACIAVLAELRKTKAFEVQVPIRPDLPADRKRITVSELTIPIDKLK